MKILKIRDHGEMADRAAEWFHQKWSIPLEEYQESMAEYLTPGVYVEEFDSAEPPMANVSTSTVGFIGVAEKGPQYGAPVLITNFASFRRK